MVHCGYEPSAVIDSFSSFGKFFQTVKEFLPKFGPDPIPVPVSVGAAHAEVAPSEFQV